MATSFHSKPIVTDGLVLYADSNSIKSYPGSGTTWSDMKLGNNITLTGGITYDGNYFNFDGVDDYGLVSPNSSLSYGTGDFTWDFWVNCNNWVYEYIVDHDANGGVICFYNGDMPYYNPTINVSGPLYAPGFGSTPDFINNRWYNLVASRISGITYLYRDGVLISSDTDTHNYGSHTIYIGRYGGSFVADFNGKMSNIKIYKGKGLTSNEVMQNYDALKNRFI